jgi:putative nucleotidyltransferase with HDIG domain
MQQQFSDLIVLLSSGINQRRMYFDDHPKVQAISREFVENFGVMLEQSNKDKFSFGVFSSKFIHKGKHLVGPSIVGRSLIEFAENMNCGGFVFKHPISHDVLVKFFRLGANQKDRLDNIEDARRLFSSKGLSQISLLKPFTDANGSEETEGDESKSELTDDNEFMTSDFLPLLQAYQSLYETVAANNLALSGDQRIDLEKARSSGKELIAVSDQGALDVMQFMRYPDFDSYTIGHSVRVAALGVLVARALGWPQDLQNDIATAGLLHDLGKGNIPDEILFKPGRLSTAERRIMENHSALGARVLLNNGETNSIVLSAAWGHHLREDGGGYPAMPPWFVRSSAAALVHVCDVFEALTAVRPYKNSMSPRRAYEIMINDKGAFQPRMLAALIRTLGLYPPGSEVILSDGSRAVVVTQGSSPDLPYVRVTHNDLGKAIPSTSQPAIHLDKESELRIDEFVNVGVELDDVEDPADLEQEKDYCRIT